MANSIYLTMKGKLQGLISQGCSSEESIGSRYQSNHMDQIFIFSLNHNINRNNNSNHNPIVIVKPIDKSSPLLGVAISENEELDCTFDFYRTNAFGQQELYYTIVITGATITNISMAYPHSLNHSSSQPQEAISLKYRNIVWNHKIAGTQGYSVWDDRVN